MDYLCVLILLYNVELQNYPSERFPSTHQLDMKPNKLLQFLIHTDER